MFHFQLSINKTTATKTPKEGKGRNRRENSHERFFNPIKRNFSLIHATPNPYETLGFF